MLREISKSQILDRIQFENPWWITGRIDADYNELPRRVYFELLKPLVFEQDIRRALVLMGPRRVGKTVLLLHMVQELIDQGRDPKKIIFITIENPIYNNILLEHLFQYAKEASGNEDPTGWTIIFDEIQYCKDWEVHLKSLVDSYRKDKFIVSGSAAAALKLASVESGAGRFTDFLLPPLTFYEYVKLKNIEHLLKPSTRTLHGHPKPIYTSTFMDELNKHCLDYINFGGYPEVIFSEKIQSNPGRYIRQDIVDKVLLRDLPSIYGISDTRELNSLFTTICYNSGGEFSLETLSIQSQVKKDTLRKYITYLEAAYLIQTVKRIDQSGKRFKRDNFFKIYLTNPSLRSALFSPITATDESMGNMVETAVFSQWMHSNWFTPWYARWTNGEVDMVGLNPLLKPDWALEIKWTNRYVEKPNELKSLIKFCTENKLTEAIVTTINREETIVHNDITIHFIPTACYAYMIGRNTIEYSLNQQEL